MGQFSNPVATHPRTNEVEVPPGTLEADPNKIPHKICFNMSKQDQITDFPQNSRKVKRVVIMNIGISVALDLYRFLIQ